MITPNELDNIQYQERYITGHMKEKSKTLRYIKEKTYIGMFDGVNTFLEYVESQHPKPHPQYSNSTDGGSGNWAPFSANSGGAEFNAFESYEQAMDVFKNRPHEVVNFSPKEMFITDIIERGKDVTYDVSGDFVDIGRHLEGDPAEFGSLYDGTARNRRATIVFSMTHSGSVSHKPISYRGERIIRLVDALENAQVRTELRGIESSNCCHIDIILKRHDQPFTITDVAVASHPEFLRRPCFRFSEWSPTQEYGYGNGEVLGNAMKPSLLTSDMNDELVIWVDGNMTNMKTIEETFDTLEKWTMAELTKDVPEVSVMMVGSDGTIKVESNGTRSAKDIVAEFNK